MSSITFLDCRGREAKVPIDLIEKVCELYPSSFLGGFAEVSINGVIKLPSKVDGDLVLAEDVLAAAQHVTRVKLDNARYRSHVYDFLGLPPPKDEFVMGDGQDLLRRVMQLKRDHFEIPLRSK